MELHIIGRDRDKVIFSGDNILDTITAENIEGGVPHSIETLDVSILNKKHTLRDAESLPIEALIKKMNVLKGHFNKHGREWNYLDYYFVSVDMSSTLESDLLTLISTMKKVSDIAADVDVFLDDYEREIEYLLAYEDKRRTHIDKTDMYVNMALSTTEYETIVKSAFIGFTKNSFVVKDFIANNRQIDDVLTSMIEVLSKDCLKPENIKAINTRLGIIYKKGLALLDIVEKDFTMEISVKENLINHTELLSNYITLYSRFLYIIMEIPQTIETVYETIKNNASTPK